MRKGFRNSCAHFLFTALMFALFCLTGQAAFAADVSGTVVNATGKPNARVYVKAFYQYGGDQGIGVSIAAPGPFAIRGIQDGTYVLRAFMDVTDSGVMHVSDPVGESSLITVSGGSVTGSADITLSSPSSPVPLASGYVQAAAASGAALVMWDEPRDEDEFIAAETYTVEWSSDGFATVAGSRAGIKTDSDSFAIITGLEDGVTYTFRVRSVIGDSEAVSSPSAAVTVGTPPGGHAVSGTVTIAGPAPLGPLYIAAGNDETGSFFITRLDTPYDGVSFTIPGVADGSYRIYAFTDENDNGLIDLGDRQNGDADAPFVSVTGSDVSEVSLSIANASGFAAVRTGHWVATPPDSDSYNLNLRVDVGTKRPVNAYVSGPNIPPMDMALTPWGELAFWQYIGSTRPNIFPPDTYTFDIQYSDGSSETVTVPVSAVLDTPPVPVAPVGSVSGTPASFTWNPPDPQPAWPYSYSVHLEDANHNFRWEAWELPGNQTTVPYDGQPLADGTYHWSATLRDMAGNEVSKGAQFTIAGGTAPSIYTASGTYDYDSASGLLSWNWTSTDFVCDGPEPGMGSDTVTTLTATTLTWGSGADSMTWTRGSGTSGDIVGTWSSTDGSTGNSWLLTFNPDGTVSVTGTIYQCSDGGGTNPPITQVVNNTGGLLYQVDVGNIAFTENLSYCGGGCSTGFLDVAEGASGITVRESTGSAPLSLGSLGSFYNNNSYAVNIRNVSGYCAELWQRFDTSSTFNDDTTKTLIATTCGGGAGDTQAPSVPTGVTATAVSSNRVDVSWNISTDNVGVSYYQVYRNGAPAGTPAGPTNNYWPDTFVVENTTYTYTVAACDAAGNCSAPSSPATVTTPSGGGTGDTTPPTTFATPAGGTFSSPQTVTLSANEQATIYYTTDGSTPTTSSPVYTGQITISTTTTLRFFAQDTAGNVETVRTENYTIATFGVTPYISDADTILLDHFDGATSASILAYTQNGQACGSPLPSTTPSYAYVAGPDGLDQALKLEPPAGQPVGSRSYLQYPGGQLLSQPNGTIEFWAYLTSWGQGGVDQGPYYGSCAGWTLGFGTSSTGQLQAGAWAAFNMNSGAVTVPLNAWTHVAVTWGSAGARLYMNGVQVGSDPNTGMPASGFGGSVLIPAGDTWIIDELRISNVQRTTFNAYQMPAAGITYSGAVTDSAGVPIAGAVIEMVGEAAVSTVSAADGSFALGGLPVGATFSFMIGKDGYLPTYSHNMNRTTNGSSWAPYSLFTAAEVASWGITPGKGVITGRVVDNDNPATGYIGGAVVTATSALHPGTPYQVVYFDGTGWGGTATYANGKYRVLDVDDGDTVMVTATKAGWSFTPRTFLAHGDAVGQSRISGVAGLVADWHLDEGTGSAAADATGANNGTLVNGPQWTEGKLGSALNFDGATQYVKVKNGAILGSAPNFTIEAWVRWDGATTAHDHQMIYCEGSYNDIVDLMLDGGVPAFFTLGDIWRSAKAASPVSAGVWHHLVAVLEAGAGGKLYVDGQLAASNPLMGAGSQYAGETDIGRFAGNGGSRYFSGIIDEVRVFNTARSASQILADYQSGGPAGTVPIITGFDPANGPIDTPVTIYGSGFGSSSDGNSVKFNGQPAGWISSWSDTQIVATVPSTASGSGPITVTTSGGTATSATSFTVTAANPDNPDISVTPGTVSFMDAPVGQSSPSQLVTISNTGSADLSINSWWFQGNADPFSIGPDVTSCPPPPTTLPPGGSCTLVLVFAPQYPGAFSAQLAISTNDPDTGTAYVDLQGTGGYPTTPADVTYVFPPPGATGVSPVSAIFAGFDQPMDPASVTAQSFRLLAPDSTPVPGSVLYDGERAIFLPASPLAPGTYTAEITTGVLNAGGISLADPVSWSYTVVSLDDTFRSALEGGGIFAPEERWSPEDPPRYSIMRLIEDHLSESQRIFNAATGQWEPVTGSDGRYALTPQGWVLVADGPDGGTVTFNADGTFTYANATDGEQLRVSVAEYDPSGQPVSGYLDPATLAVNPETVFPAGSRAYGFAFERLADSYRVDIWNDGTSTVDTNYVRYWDGSSEQVVTDLDQLLAIFAAGNEQRVGIARDTEIQFGADGTLPIYRFGQLVHTGSWESRTVYGQTLIVTTIPPEYMEDHEPGEKRFFAVVEGVVKQGGWEIAGTTSIDDRLNFNETAFNGILSGFQPGYPVAVLTGAPAAVTSATNATINVGGHGVVFYIYSLDGAPSYDVRTTESPIELFGLGDGTHTLAVIAADASGNWQPGTAATVVSWTVDTVPPTAVLTGAPTGTTTSASAEVTVGGTGVVAYKYRLNGGGWSAESPVAAKISLTLSDGAQTLEVVGRDAAGNWQETPTSVTWTVNAGPKPTIAIGTASGSKGGTVNIPVTLANVSGKSLSLIWLTVNYDPNVLGGPVVSAGAAAVAAGKDVLSNLESPGTLKISISGVNSTEIGDGTIANISFSIGSTAATGASAISGSLTASNPAGDPVAVQVTAGSVTVVAKAGDCNSDGKVSGSEVQSVINLFLGYPASAACDEYYRGKTITASDAQKAINNYLGI